MGYAYFMVRTVNQAVALLHEQQGRIIAGGTDLVLDLRSGKKTCQAVVDITDIPECGQISLENDFLRIGACCTFAQLEASPLVQRYATALAQASSFVGSPQIRNVATIGGNVVNAMPAADGAVALVGLNAQAEIAGADGLRLCRVEDCYRGIGQSTVDAGREFICAFRVPLGTEGTWRSAYKRFALRQSLALPVVAAAAGIGLQEKRIVSCRLALAPAGTAPWRAEEAETYLKDRTISRETATVAAGLAAQAAPFRDSPVRCSAAYKRMLAETMVCDALLDAAGNLAD